VLEVLLHKGPLPVNTIAILPMFDPQLALAGANLIASLLDKLLSSLLVTVFVGSFVFWLTPNGPFVDLTPGSISIAVDRLVAKALVSRLESAEDRRVRIVALTLRGKDLIAGAFRKHSGQMRKVFSELSSEDLRGLEVALKKVGKRAAALIEES
jgi:DNA-binding PadR family transcriptional regulator